MTLLAHRAVIRRLVDSLWVVPQGLDEKVAWPGVAFDPPDLEEAQVWARVEIEDDRRNLATLSSQAGGKRIRSRGSLVCQVFGSPDEGEENVGRVAGALVTALENRTLDGVIFYTADPKLIERAPGARERAQVGAWIQLNVVIPFHADVIG